MGWKMRRRLLHYAILAIVLFGAPAFFAWVGGRDEIWEGVKSFPPRTEDWGFHSEKLWNHRCPFSWPWFIGMALFTFVCMRPLVKRFIAGVRAAIRKSCFANDREASAVNRVFPWWGWLGVFEMIVAWVVSWSRFRCFESIQPHISYMPLWIGYILVVNALCVKRSGKSPLTSHTGAYLLTFPASSLFWWFFEYLNRYVWNWYYLGVSQMDAVEYALYATICFASVLPAVTATAAWLHTFTPFADSRYDGMGKVNLRGWRALSVLSAVAALGLSGIVFFPQYAFALLWLSPLMVFLLVQIALGEPSVLDRLADGNWALVFRFAVAALICGFAWETWNYFAYAKWVYSVPFVYRFQVWEMPLVGFAGYLPFGVECAAVTAWICPALAENDN